jgi:hypothetical protein
MTEIEQIAPVQQAKDRLFRAIVHALSGLR